MNDEFDHQNMQDEAVYFCDVCGEEIVIPIDVSAGSGQRFVEDCPVCCNPNVISLNIDPDGNISVRAEKETD